MPPLPLQNSVVVVESETESESEIESQPDRSFYVEDQNQLGLPEYQFGVYCSSSPRVNADDINNDDSNNKTNVNERNDANEGNDPRATNTEILLSVGDKKKTKIKVQVEDTHHSNSTVKINIKHANFRGEKHEREIEGMEETSVHVQVKRTRK